MRITVDTVAAGETTTAAALNADFATYTSATTSQLNEANLATAGVDIPQIKVTTDIIEVFAATGDAGTGNVDGTVPFNIANSVASPATIVPFQDGSGNPQILNFSANPIVMAANDVLRVYFTANVYCYPYDPSMAGRAFDERDESAIVDETFNSNWCWGVWPQYASTLTMGAPTGWTEIPDQSDMKDTVGAYTGANLYDCPHIALIAAQQRCDAGSGAAGSSPSGQWIERGYQPVIGTAYYKPAAPFTIYGLRLVGAGVFHTYYQGGDNQLVLDTTFPAGSFLRVYAANITVQVLKDR